MGIELHYITQYLKETENGCLEWQRGKTSNGYGVVWHKRKPYYVHRMMYLLTHGQYDPTLEVCHTCDNPSCGRIEHLFLGTHRDNMQDAKQKGRISGQTPGLVAGREKIVNYRRALTHCKYGHTLSGDNLRVYPYRNSSMRICLACRARRNREC